MSKHWKNKKLKYKQMENLKVEKQIFEVEQKEEPVEAQVIQLRNYKTKFLEVQAYQLSENSRVHCADGKILEGKAGDFYVMLDKVQEFILCEEIFRKLFLLKIEK